MRNRCRSKCQSCRFWNHIQTKHWRTHMCSSIYKVVQIWPGQTVTCLHTISPGHIWTTLYFTGRSRWPYGLRHRSAAAGLLGSPVWILLGAWMFVSCVCCCRIDRGLSDGPITRPMESYRVCACACVCVCHCVLKSNSSQPSTVTMEQTEEFRIKEISLLRSLGGSGAGTTYFFISR
jgi:hypothetical protein